MIGQATVYRGVGRSLLSIAVGLFIAGLLIQAAGFSPISAFSALWTGATGLQGGPAKRPTDIPLGTGHLDQFQLAQSLATVAPLLFCGLAVALALRAGLFNIGAQGQMTVGALAAAYVGLIGSSGGGRWLALLHLAAVIAAGALAGALWGALAGLLKAWRGVHEVISTIMLNFLGIDLVNYLVSHSLRDPHSQNLQTSRIASTAVLAPLVPHSNLTLGLALAICAAMFVRFLLARTSAGFVIRAVGLNPDAAQAAGVSTARTLVYSMALSGGLAGIAGALEVMSVHHRYVDGLAGTYGFDGIAVALLGGSGGGAVLSALFFGLLASGSDAMQSMTSVPAPVSVVVQAVVILFVGMRRLGWRRPTRIGDGASDPPPPGDVRAIGESVEGAAPDAG